MKSIKVIIIQDDSLFSTKLENILKHLGHNVVSNIKCTKKALNIVLTNHIDLVITDINIDCITDNISLYKTLYKQYSIPIICITAYKDEETLKVASKIDFVGYIIKPFRKDELKALINIAIYKYNLPKLNLKLTIDHTYSYCLKTDKLFYYEDMIPLTKAEAKFIKLLINSKGEMVPYNTIEQNLWNGTIVTDDTRRQLIYRFKKKLQDFPLELKKGFGYRLVIDEVRDLDL